MPDIELIIGSTVSGFTVSRVLGVGSTAAVYLGVDGDKYCALKLFTGLLQSDDHKRFQREAQYLQQIEHPGIVRIFGSTTMPESERPILILEYVPDGDLKTFRNRQVELNQFSIDKAVLLVAQISTALAYAFEKHSIIHRDLKLENVLVSSEPLQAKVIDFGLLRDYGNLNKLPTSWEMNAASRFRSPEKWRDFHEVDEKSDVWSLGVILYYLVSGHYPFASDHISGSEAHLMSQVLGAEPLALREHNQDIPADIDVLVTRFMLSKRRELRPSLGELAHILSSSAEHASPISDSLIEMCVRRGGAFGAKAVIDVRSSIDPIGQLFSESQRQETIATIDAAILRVVSALLRAPVKWGPSFESGSRRVANVCEALLTLREEDVAPDPARKDIEESIVWLADRKVSGGYPSLTLGIPTTICTALAVLAFSHVSRFVHLKSHLREMAKRESLESARDLVSLKGALGWGTWASQSARMHPTIWAVIALLEHPELFEKEITESLTMVRSHNSAGFPGCYGFRAGLPPKVATTAAFLVLCEKAESSGIKIMDRRPYEAERYAGARFVVKAMDAHAVPPTENEQYYVDAGQLTGSSTIEQLTWIHPAGPLAIEALARNMHWLGIGEEAIQLKRAAMNLCEAIDLNGRYWDAVMSENNLDHPLFPSTYACRALSMTRKWLSAFSGSVRLPGPYPRPNIVEGKIRKSGAAIIESGRLLLLRKFGTRMLIVPGGGIEKGEEPLNTIRREVREELNVEIEVIDPTPVGTYVAPAAFEPGATVEVVLFRCKLGGTPHPTSEIEEIVWYQPGDSYMLTPIVEEKIIPDLRERGWL